MQKMRTTWQKFEITGQIPKDDKIKYFVDQDVSVNVEMHQWKHALCDVFPLRSPVNNEDRLWISQDFAKNWNQSHSDHEILLNNQISIEFLILQISPRKLFLTED